LDFILSQTHDFSVDLGFLFTFALFISFMSGLFFSNMSLHRSLVIACVFAILTSCFGAISDPVELPYDEKLVIRALLVVGEPLNDIQISRTLPPLDTFSYEKVFVGNANVTLTIDGQPSQLELQVRTTTATTTPYRSLYRIPNLRVQAGKTYALNVEWQSPSGKKLVAQASTRTPTEPQIDSVRVTVTFPLTLAGTPDTVFTTEAFTKGRPNEMMRVGSLVLNPVGQVIATRGYGEVTFFEQIAQSVLQSNSWRFTSATTQILTGQLQTRAIVETYDGDYYKYYQTRNRSGQPSPLNPGGPNIDWNVKGDGIGVFAGMIQTQRRANVQR
jgi:hypothetical protein